MPEKISRPSLNQTILGRYYIEKMIGEGNYGKVYNSFDSETNLRVAVKIIDLKGSKTKNLKKYINLEVGILEKLDHKNIIKLLNYFEIDDHYYLVYELCNEGDLFTLIKKQSHLSELDSLEILKTMVEAFLYLRKNYILHRDVKPENIFLNDGVLKLGDFGLSKRGIVVRDKVRVGSPIFQAPEIHSYCKYTSKSDVYASGLCLYEMLTGSLPFKQQTTDELYYEKMGFEIDSSLKEKLTCGTIAILEGMLAPKESSRLSFKEVNSLLKDTINYLRENQAIVKNLKERSSSHYITNAYNQRVNYSSRNIKKNQTETKKFMSSKIRGNSRSRVKNILEEIQHKLHENLIISKINQKSMRDLNYMYHKKGLSNQDKGNRSYESSQNKIRKNNQYTKSDYFSNLRTNISLQNQNQLPLNNKLSYQKQKKNNMMNQDYFTPQKPLNFRDATTKNQRAFYSNNDNSKNNVNKEINDLDQRGSLLRRIQSPDHRSYSKKKKSSFV